MARQNGSLAVHSNFTYRCTRSLQICIFPREVLEGYIIDFPLIRRFFYSISFTTITWLLAAKLWWRKEPCFHKCEKGEENVKKWRLPCYIWLKFSAYSSSLILPVLNIYWIRTCDLPIGSNGYQMTHDRCRDEAWHLFFRETNRWLADNVARDKHRHGNQACK